VRALREQLQRQLLRLHHLLRQGLQRSRPRILERRARRCCTMQKAHCFSLMTRRPKHGESAAVASSESIKLLTVEALAVQCVCLHVWRCLSQSGLPELASNWVKWTACVCTAADFGLLCWDVIVCICYIPVAQNNAFRRAAVTTLLWDKFAHAMKSVIEGLRCVMQVKPG